MSSRILISIPVLNEAENISPLLDRIDGALKGEDYVVCIVDDGSRDGTRALVEERSYRNPGRIHFIQRTKRQRGSQRGGALAAALEWGVAKTTCDIFIEMDGDLSHRPEELPAGIEMLRQRDADVVIASKYAHGSSVLDRPMGRRLVSRICTAAVWLFLSRSVRDYSNGFRFYNRRAAELILNTKTRFTSPIYLSEVLALWLSAGLAVREVPTTYVGRGEGLSKLRWTDLAKASLAVLEISMRYHITGFKAISATETSKRPPHVALREDPQPSRRSEIVADRCLTGILVAAALGAVVFAWGSLWFVDHEPVVDDLGLFNPIYTYLKTGNMTYPIYAFYDAIIVHPPVHYWIVANFMRLTGLTAEAAAILPVVFWLAVATAAAATSRWSIAAKFGFIAGPLIAVVMFAPPQFIRPDVDQAAAWIAGLVLLETSRIQGWTVGRAAAGAAVLSLAAILHYPSTPSVLGVGVYGMWCLLERRRAAARLLVALGVGSGLVLIPYVALYMLPHEAEIRAFLKSAQRTGSMRAAVDTTRAQYHYFQSSVGDALLSRVASPLTRLGIPAVCITTPVLFWRRETRGIALASLPQLVFLLLYVEEKNIFYYTPEFALYFATVVYAALLATGEVASRLRLLGGPVTPSSEEVQRTSGTSATVETLFVPRPSRGWGVRPVVVRTVVALAGVAALVAIAMSGKAAVAEVGTRTWSPLHADMDIARMVGQEALRPNALVASDDLSVWYTSGASRFYTMRGLNQARDLELLHVPSFLAGFDAVATSGFDTWAMMNLQHQAVAEWYRTGLLRVRGFYFGDRRGFYAPRIKYLLLSRGKHAVAGATLQGRTLYRYRENSAGTSVLVSALCRASADTTPYQLSFFALPGLDWQTAMPLPGATYPDVPSREVLSVFVDSVEQYRAHLAEAPAGYSCRPLGTTRLTVTAVSAASALAAWRAHPQARMSFPRNVRQEQLLYGPAGPVRVIAQADLGAALRDSVTRSGRSVVVRTPATQYAQALYLPVTLTRRPGLAWLRVWGSVTQGSVGICALDLGPARHGCPIRQELSAPAGGPFYIPFRPSRDRWAFYLDSNESARATMVIRRIEVVAAAPRRHRASRRAP